MITVGAELAIFYQDGNPNNEVIQIRAIVDDDWVVLRSWSEQKEGWKYRVEPMSGLEWLRSQNWLTDNQEIISKLKSEAADFEEDDSADEEDDSGKVPWPDFSGNPIYAGDTIRHPNGTTGVVVKVPASSPSDAWVVDYGDNHPSRLWLQIGEKGRAVVIHSTVNQKCSDRNICPQRER